MLIFLNKKSQKNLFKEIAFLYNQASGNQYQTHPADQYVTMDCHLWLYLVELKPCLHLCLLPTQLDVYIFGFIYRNKCFHLLLYLQN